MVTGKLPAGGPKVPGKVERFLEDFLHAPVVGADSQWGSQLVAAIIGNIPVHFGKVGAGFNGVQEQRG